MRIELDLWVSLLLYLPRAYSRYQLSDVAKGLYYLHFCSIVHGDLKGVRCYSKSRFTTVLTPRQLNVLVDNFDRARITDFGLATVTQNLDSARSTHPQRGHTVRWAAPEILDDGPHSKEADVFAFAMVMIEVRHEQSTVYTSLAYCQSC
jgi:serine/threonine protein kinase